MLNNLSTMGLLFLLAVASFALAFSMSGIDTTLITPILFSAMGVSYLVTIGIFHTQIALPES